MRKFDRSWVRSVAAAAVVAGICVVGAKPAMAQEMEEEAPVNAGNISVGVYIDVATAYWFRGLAQENQGLIVQPGADLSLTLFSQELGPGELSVSLDAGVWNSLHGGPSGAGNDNIENNWWYEADFYGGATVSYGPGSLGVHWVSLYSPAGGGSFAEEVDISLSFDDSFIWEDIEMLSNLGFALNPSILVAIETQGGSDNGNPFGNDRGTYYELAMAPGVTIAPTEKFEFSVSVPMRVGLGDNYYEDGFGDDDTFGFAEIGMDVSVPLLFIPAEYGSWSVHAGAYAIYFGDAAQTIAGPNGFGVAMGEEFEFYGVMGIGFEY